MRAISEAWADSGECVENAGDGGSCWFWWGEVVVEGFAVEVVDVVIVEEGESSEMVDGVEEEEVG